MKVALSAYACGPGEGSERGAGWEWARAAAQRHDVWLFTDVHWVDPVRAAVAAEPGLRLTVVPVPVPEIVNWRGEFSRGERMRYAAWQAFLRRTVRETHAKVRFDVAHHVTYASDWMPAGVAALRDVPFIWGPVGGTSPLPLQFWRWLGPRQLGVEIARGLITGGGRVVFGERLSHRATTMLAANHDVAARFRHAHPIVEPNIALHLDRLPAHPADPADATGQDSSAAGSGSGQVAHGAAKRVRRAVYAGRFLGWKGVRLAVAALGRPEARDWVLDLYGNGPDEPAIRAACDYFGVTSRVRFRGLRPREEVLAAFASCDALLFPSMHDSAGWVVAEAMALGCPVVCLDIGGPAMLVGGDGRRGVRVSPRGDVPGGLAAALRDLPGRTEPDTRFDARRLPDLLDELYSKAVGAG
ncbi:MAG: glycosyltransferase family 4 protein [Frankia sp.]|nr:glycosyltransferase family 4 protein [Frankia sp.]